MSPGQVTLSTTGTLVDIPALSDLPLLRESSGLSTSENTVFTNYAKHLDIGNVEQEMKAVGANPIASVVLQDFQ